MARATVALTPQIQKRMDVLSKVFEGWEEDCMNCKAFAASLADWTTPKGAEVIREGEDAAQPQLLICESGAAEVFVTTTTKSGAKKQKRVARLVAPFYVGEGQVIARSVPTATIKAAQDLNGFSLDLESCDELLRTDSLAIRLVKRQIEIRAFERAPASCGGDNFSRAFSWGNDEK
jgi:hypothetical protein